MIQIAIKVVGADLAEAEVIHVRTTVIAALSLAHTPYGAEVVVRRLRRPVAGTRHHVLVVAKTSEGRYYAIGVASDVATAVERAALELRTTLARASLPETAGIEHLRRQAFEQSYNRQFIETKPQAPARLAR